MDLIEKKIEECSRERGYHCSECTDRPCPWYDRRKIRNFTPHQINIFDLDGKTEISILESEGNARVSFVYEILVNLPIPIGRQKFGPVEGLPNKKTGVRLIVSRMVAAALPDRDDLLVPGDPLRDENGRIIGSKGLIRT